MNLADALVIQQEIVIFSVNIKALLISFNKKSCMKAALNENKFILFKSIRVNRRSKIGLASNTHDYLSCFYRVSLNAISASFNICVGIIINIRGFYSKGIAVNICKIIICYCIKYMKVFRDQVHAKLY